MTVDEKPPALNSVDLGVTVLLTFFWLCAASSLAWAKGQIYDFTIQEAGRCDINISSSLISDLLVIIVTIK